MSFGNILGPLAVFAGSTIGAFVVAVGIDIVFGIVLAIKQHKFDPRLLPSFMESQFGSQKALALLGIVAAAVMTAVGSALIHGGLTQTALQGVADAALAAATAGAATMMLSVLSDVFGKFGQLTGAPAIAPLPITPAKP